MKSPKTKLYILFSGFCLALGLGFSTLIFYKLSQAQRDARIFQREYLASMERSIDLGKNINSHSDFLNQQIMSSQGRNDNVFAPRAKDSLAFLAQQEVLPARVKRDLSHSFERLMLISKDVRGHLREGDDTLARKIYQNDFMSEFKNFQLGLDSHKKFLQEKARVFFKQKLSRGNGQVLGWTGAALMALVCSCWLLMVWRLGRACAIALGQAEIAQTKAEQLADSGFRNHELLEKIRALCEEGLAAKSGNDKNQYFAAILVETDEDQETSISHNKAA